LACDQRLPADGDDDDGGDDDGKVTGTWLAPKRVSAGRITSLINCPEVTPSNRNREWVL